MEKSREQPDIPPRPTCTTSSWKPLIATIGVAAAIATILYHKSPFLFTAPPQTHIATQVVEPIPLVSWMELERPIALQGILNNIGPSGSKVAGARPGIVVASPSKADPDYFYTWTRDSALTIKTLVDEFLSTKSPALDSLIQEYISAQAQIQGIENPSGGLCSGGLGEAKFNVDETAFTGDWGRPQRDGPALRAIAMIAYGRHLIDGGRNETVSSNIWPIVQNDLSYVVQHWNESTFDLWEEVNGSSFFTTAMQYRALVEGMQLAQDIGKSFPQLQSQAPEILCFLQSYWTGSYMLSNTGSGRSGKDINSILTSTHMFDPQAGCDVETFQSCSDKALANHKVVTDSFRHIYTINAGVSAGFGVAIGRYPEDVYMGGNPWYLGAFAAAEMLWQAVFQWKQLGEVNVTAISLSFFRDVYSNARIGTFAASSVEFRDIIDAVSSYADSYMINAQQYTPPDGSLAEQYSRENGLPVSAVDLTWSYAAFLTAYNARKSDLPASWGATRIDLPRTCSGSSAAGPCSTATNTTWLSTVPTSPCATPSLTTLVFELRKRTRVGQDIFVSGNISQLGNWDADQSLPLSAGKYTQLKPVWYGFEKLPVGTTFEYKYILKYGGLVTWEAGQNRGYTVPASCDVSKKIEDEWR